MNRNQKIALGCGGAGCLGLIVVAIAGGLIYFFMRNAATNRNYNFNVSTNRNPNSNDNSDLTTNRNDNDNLSNSNRSSSSSDSSTSDDDKHKLYQAALMLGDAEVLRRVEIKLGLRGADYTLGDNYQTFVNEHVDWSLRNTDFITSLNTAEKARTYINEHME